MLDIDRLDTTSGAITEQALLSERALEVVTELCVLHDALLRPCAYGTMPRHATR